MTRVCMVKQWGCVIATSQQVLLWNQLFSQQVFTAVSSQLAAQWLKLYKWEKET